MGAGLGVSSLRPLSRESTNTTPYSFRTFGSSGKTRAKTPLLDEILDDLFRRMWCTISPYDPSFNISSIMLLMAPINKKLRKSVI